MWITQRSSFRRGDRNPGRRFDPMPPSDRNLPCGRSHYTNEDEPPPHNEGTNHTWNGLTMPKNTRTYAVIQKGAGKSRKIQPSCVNRRVGKRNDRPLRAVQIEREHARIHQSLGMDASSCGSSIKHGISLVQAITSAIRDPNVSETSNATTLPRKKMVHVENMILSVPSGSNARKNNLLHACAYSRDTNQRLPYHS